MEPLEEGDEQACPVGRGQWFKNNCKWEKNHTMTGANRSLLFSMFYNVINNAVKHTPDGGNIDVTGIERTSRFEISVCDTGAGMSQEQLDRLFTRFSNRPDPEGNSTGIGLAITKSIADFHNIAIRVLSEPGRGTQFFFFFPVNSL